MKNIIVVFLCILVICCSSNLQAQGVHAVPFLNYDLSPKLNGLAGAFTALPTNDVYGAYYNPAQIGIFSQQNNFALGFYPQKTDWFPGLNFSDWNFYATAFAVGYSFSGPIPVNVGFSYIYSKFDLGENVWTDATGLEIGKFNSYETCNAYTIGVGSEYFLKYYFGITYKSISSNLIPVKINQLDGNAESSAFDFGMIISIPVSELLLLENIINKTTFIPVIDFSIGYSVHNIGDELDYGNADQGDPLPRQARLGYGLSWGLNYNYSNNKIRLFKFDYSTEARDFLTYREGEDIKYKSIFGDINFFENVIGGSTSDQVVIHRGWRINLFDTFTYSKGGMRSRGFLLFEKSYGYSISTKGIFDWVQNKSQESTIKYIANHFSLVYAWSKYKSDNEVTDNTTHKGIQLNLFGYW